MAFGPSRCTAFKLPVKACAIWAATLQFHVWHHSNSEQQLDDCGSWTPPQVLGLQVKRPSSAVGFC